MDGYPYYMICTDSENVWNSNFVLLPEIQSDLLFDSDLVSFTMGFNLFQDSLAHFGVPCKKDRMHGNIRQTGGINLNDVRNKTIFF